MPNLSFLKIISNWNAKYVNYNSELHSQLVLITAEKCSMSVWQKHKEMWGQIFFQLNRKAYFGNETF